MKKRYAFISNMAAPYQVKLCYALQKYFDAEFWFYEYIDESRPAWWKIPLGDKCKVMKFSGKIPKRGYYSFGVFYDLIRFKPDIILLGGFMKWNWIIFRVAKLLHAKVIVMSEPLRYVSNDDNKSNNLMNRENSNKKIKLLKKLFNGVDLYLGMGEVASKQFIEEFGFEKDKVKCASYPQDIEEYYKHPLRQRKENGNYKLLFANRLVERYQPVFALKVFQEISRKYPNLEMYMNNEGSQKKECLEFIESNKIKNVYFLDGINSWNDMHLIYKSCDILILPATYSNGNGTIIEARASGMGIVISNRINHIERHSIDGKNCFICDLDIKQFTNAIENYINNPELFTSHGELSRKMVEYRKNESTAKLYYELYKESGLLN